MALSNLPPGVTDAMIDEQVSEREPKDIDYNPCTRCGGDGFLFQDEPCCTHCGGTGREPISNT